MRPGANSTPNPIGSALPLCEFALADAMDVFLEKFRRPDPKGLVRERLVTTVASLQPGSDGPASMALVIGPPGSGKTTLLSHLATSGHGTAWYGVGPEDDDEEGLTRHLGHALGHAIGDEKIVAAAADGRIAGLIAALDGRKGTVQLIIDDVHEIAGTAAERALGTFLAMRSHDVKVILGSRRPPLINTSRMVVSGELIELDGDDLRFRSWEVEQLFRTVYAAPLSPEGAAALTRRTGGWAAGLHLFHLATAQFGRAEREHAIEELGGRSRLVRSYLASTVLNGLDPERRRFLQVTSTLGVLTAELCDELLGTTDSAQVLARLEEEQLFTTSTDGGVTYRYHQILQTQLEAQLVSQMGGRATRELYLTSGQLLERAGLMAEAVHAYARSEDWDAVTRLLKPAAIPVEARDGLLGMLSLPGAPTGDPGLILTEARLLARRGRLGDAVAAYDRAEELIDDPSLSSACAMERQSVSLWLSSPDARICDADPAGPSSQLRMVLRVEDAVTAEPLAHVVQLIMTGNLDLAATELTACDRGSGWPALALRLTECLIDLLHGANEMSAAQIEPIVLECEAGGWLWMERIARGLQTAILVAAEPSACRIVSAMELLDTLGHQRDVWTECLTSLAIGVGFAHVGHDDLATQALARAAILSEDLGAPVVRQWADRLAGDTAMPASAFGNASPSAPFVDMLKPAPMSVRLTCLGAFSMTVDGREVDWRSLRPRARSLLMLLAARHGQAVHREELVDSLWPDLSLPSGIRSLQVAVSSIRHCLWAAGMNKETLRRQGDTYVLALPDAVDQLRSFERLVSDATHETGEVALRLRSEALELYAGDLLTEAGPAEWVVASRDRLRNVAASIAYSGAMLALEAGQARTALALARRSTDIDPCHDLSWDLVIESSARLGDWAAVAVARLGQAKVRASLGVVTPAGPAVGARPARSSGLYRHLPEDVRRRDRPDQRV